MHVSAVDEMYVIFGKSVTRIGELEFYFALEHVNYLYIVVDMPRALLYLQYLHFYRQIFFIFDFSKHMTNLLLAIPSTTGSGKGS